MKVKDLIRNYKPALLGSLKVARDLQLFEKWYKHGDTPRTSQELIEIVSCDGTFLRESYISLLFLPLAFLKRKKKIIQDEYYAISPQPTYYKRYLPRRSSKLPSVFPCCSLSSVHGLTMRNHPDHSEYVSF